MAKAIEQLASGMVIGHAKLGRHGEGRGSVTQQVHDGDTANTEAVGNFGVRFLGVDAPEVSFTLPGGDPLRFVPLTNQAWQAPLADPFAASLPPFDPPIDAALQAHLAGRVGQGTAANHARHAERAHRGLEQHVGNDLEALGHSTEEFEFFLAFAGEVMDRYGRLLGYLNRQQPSATSPSPRPLSYNERLLEGGLVTPYFIWPNVNPFRRQRTLPAAVPRPGTASQLASAESSLRRARAWVAQARDQGTGLYEPPDPLQLFPFELRFISRRQPPDRWVIDLGRGDDLLLPPQAYFTIPNPEDRLYIPSEYVPLFVEAGWRRA
jgi:endonuclease YncB( thermonuclease family)